MNKYMPLALPAPKDSVHHEPKINLLNSFLLAKYTKDVNLLGLKLIFSVLFLIQKTQLHNEDSFEIYLSDLSNLIGLNVDAYQNVREIAEVLTKSCLTYLMLKSEIWRTNSITIDLKSLKRFLGFKLSEYEIYRDFKKFVLLKIIKHLIYSDIKIDSIVEHREKRKVESLTINFSHHSPTFKQLPLFFVEEDDNSTFVKNTKKQTTLIQKNKINKNFSFIKFVDFLRHDSKIGIGTNTVVATVPVSVNESIEVKFSENGRLYSQTTGRDLPPYSAEKVYEALYQLYIKNPQEFIGNYGK
jgi:hypothetical protein